MKRLCWDIQTIRILLPGTKKWVKSEKFFTENFADEIKPGNTNKLEFEKRKKKSVL